ncbi:hypothetical protein [Paracoccus saliphilus]|uniref:Uncharacterized protein n=1 Tax=Paracoccus saliphilus TaxID=405559 RepID=A0AA46A7M4_9RHOB|nr:hypothetical protein [Paracoccus saliphilus]WCR02935.1 hypothetical protein JHX88_19355 [Paracoccus saliphilus]SIT15848.1 hypothetical protein SAMN05421772_12710 [Paracoccus saliphilus]
MALRVRMNGQIFCAALTEALPGDTYIDDALHYEMSVVHRVLVSEPAEKHSKSARWWWRRAVPAGTEIDPFYKEPQDD